MTETEWATCKNPKIMLAFLAEQRNASERQCRLFSCACCRCVWHLLSSDQARTAVEVAELHADGLAGDEELEEAQEAAAKLPSLSGVVAKWASSCVAHSGAMLVVDAAGQLAASPPDQEYDPARWTDETLKQCELLRDIFGPRPFRTVVVAPAWLTTEVRALAQAIYEARSFDRMTELGQALYRAACADRDILHHCLWKGKHARGCWVIDLLLEKESGKVSDSSGESGPER